MVSRRVRVKVTTTIFSSMQGENVFSSSPSSPPSQENIKGKNRLLVLLSKRICENVKMCSSPLSSPPFQEVASHFSDWPCAPHDALGRVGRRSAARCIWKVKSLSIDADSEVVCIRQLFPLLKNKKTEGDLSIIFMQSSQLRSRRIIKPISFWQRKVKPAEDEDTDNGAAGEDKEELVPSLLVKDVRERWTRSGYHPSLFLDRWLLQVDEKRLIKAPETQSFRFLSLSWLQKNKE